MAARMHFSIKKCSLIITVALLSDTFFYYVLLSILLLEELATLKKKRKEKVKEMKIGGKRFHQKSKGVRSCVLTSSVQNMELTSTAP